MGEIVGKAGVFCVKKLLPGVKAEKRVDFVIAQAEGTTGGFGIGKNHSVYLHKLGIDVLTGGECIYYKRDIIEHIERARYMLRPANYPHGNPGRGWRLYQKGDTNIAVVALLGQSGFDRVHLSNPFTVLSHLMEIIREQTALTIVDFHASTTAEKAAMFHYIDGRVSAVIGTHTKVMTADERIMPKGTAVITDAGRTGSRESVGGLAPDIEIRKLRTQIPERSADAWDGLELQGVLVDIEEDGRASAIERLKIPCTEGPGD
jgi:2',3'-cyclic-nucleotide 2'-phosphodiesterase